MLLQVTQYYATQFEPGLYVPDYFSFKKEDVIDTVFNSGIFFGNEGIALAKEGVASSESKLALYYTDSQFNFANEITNETLLSQVATEGEVSITFTNNINVAQYVEGTMPAQGTAYFDIEFSWVADVQAEDVELICEPLPIRGMIANAVEVSVPATLDNFTLLSPVSIGSEIDTQVEASLTCSTVSTLLGVIPTFSRTLSQEFYV